MVIKLNKPVYLMPFTLLYKLVVFIFGLIFRIIRYFNVGLFFTIYFLATLIVSSIVLELKGIIFTFVLVSYLIYSILKYIFTGFVVICYMLYRYIRYVALGFAAPFILIYDAIAKLNLYSRKHAIKKLEEADKKQN